MPRKTDFRKLTKGDLAAALDVSTQTIDQWLTRGMPYVSKPGAGSRFYEFELAAVLRWRLDYERAQQAAATDATDIDEAKRRKAVADATLAEMEVARKSGELVAVVDVDHAVTQAFARVRARMLALPSKVAAECAAIDTPAECSEVIRQAVYDALTELSETEVEAEISEAGAA